jgi:HdeA/HdeB family
MKTAAFLLLSACLVSIPVAAQSPQGDNDPLDLKSYRCAEHLDLVDLEDGRSDIVTVWAHGYYNGMRGVDEKSAADSWISVEAFSEQLLKICQQDPEKLFITAVRQSAQPKPTTQIKQTAQLRPTAQRDETTQATPAARANQTAQVRETAPAKPATRP